MSLPDRSRTGRRLYSQADIEALRFIKRCRDLDFSLQEAMALREMAATPAQACPEAAALGRRHLRDLKDKIAGLQALERDLEGLVTACDEGNATCPMLAALTSGGRKGKSD